MRQLLLIALCLAPLSARAFTGKVVAVYDGDTLAVEQGGERQRVRVFGIEAPEGDQPGGPEARRDLDGLVYGQAVEIDPPPGERRFPLSYDRIVGVVTGPAGNDIGLAMVARGDAWAYDHFHPPRAYDAAMAQAAAAGRGLWVAPAPVPPWTWRRLHPRH